MSEPERVGRGPAEESGEERDGGVRRDKGEVILSNRTITFHSCIQKHLISGENSTIVPISKFSLLFMGKSKR